MSSVSGTSGLGRLLVCGGGAVASDDSGNWYAPTPIARYMNELATHFEACTWLIRRDPPNSGVFEGSIDADRIGIVAYSPNRARRISLWLQFLLLTRSHSHALLYYPASTPLLPALPLARYHLQFMAIYLGIDHRYWSTRTRTARLPASPWLFKFAHEFPMRVADAVLARGRYLASVASNFNSRVIETYPIGNMHLEIRRSETMPDSTSAARIIFIGRIVWFKGLKDLLEATLLLLQDNRAVHLDIIGDGPDREAVDAWIHELQLKSHIDVHGYIDDPARLSRLFADADVMVVPSTDSEGVPRVIDEALATGLPVIATNVGGVAEEFTEGELMIIEPRSPHVMAKAIDSVLFNPDERARYLGGAEKRKAKWAHYNSAAQQHAEVLHSADAR